MKYAILNGQKTEAIPKNRAVCPSCNKIMIAKCGNYNIWHWSHFPEKHCDNWWENETEWHRAWKKYFPEENQEVIHFDQQTGEKHIADVKTNQGMVVEFQNSPMKLDELRQREYFYKEMIWIVNGMSFAKDFHISPYKLPPPNSDLAKDLDILRQPIYSEKKGCFEPPTIMKKSNGVSGPWGVYYDLGGVTAEIGAYNNSDKVINEIACEYKGHHFFDWKRRREVWFNTTKPVFIDLGISVLFHIARFNGDTFCLQGIDKNAMIRTLGGSLELDPIKSKVFPM